MPNSPGKPMIEAHDLTQTFRGRGRDKKPVKAVDGVSLHVDPGEIIGFLGPNGAGKTTTLRMLTTLLKPTSGSARVAGFDVATQPVEVRRHIGYVSQVGSAGSNAHAGEELMDHGMLYGLRKKDAQCRAHELFEQFSLDGLWDREPKNMSGGQRRRLDIAMGLIHSPGLVFLDEPTTGLDPQARSNLWDHIRSLREDQGATIFLTTHYLDEADALADRIIVIDHGRIIASDTAENLKSSVSGDHVSLRLDDATCQTDAAEIITRVMSGADASATPDLKVTGDLIEADVYNSGHLLPDLIRSLDEKSIGIADLNVRRPTLDDVFLSLTGRSLRD